MPKARPSPQGFAALPPAFTVVGRCGPNAIDGPCDRLAVLWTLRFLTGLQRIPERGGGMGAPGAEPNLPLPYRAPGFSSDVASPDGENPAYAGFR
jgi:hypothetical protein